MGDMNQGNDKEAHGVVKGPCRKCGQTIPEDTLTCPKCGNRRKFDQEQYDMLLRCSAAKDTSEWNEWQTANPDTDILLEAANLKAASLQGANFKHSHLEGTYLLNANLRGADLRAANLQAAVLTLAILESADLSLAHLQGAHASGAAVDGRTSFLFARVNDTTDFRAVGLATARVDAQTRSHLEYNIRRMGWQDWYEDHWVLGLFVRLFWRFSDYGRSSFCVILWFAIFCLAFALAYCWWPWLVDEAALAEMPRDHRVVRCIYFSVVTMTTLGFGDIRANPASDISHFVLSLHVLIGYVLLGALITRFAVMFQGQAVPWDRRKRPAVKNSEERSSKEKGDAGGK